MAGFDLHQMPGLTFGEGGFGLASRDHGFFLQKILQETWFVVPAAALVIAPHRFGHRLRVQLLFDGQKFKEQFHQPHQSDADGAARARSQPVAEAEEGV